MRPLQLPTCFRRLFGSILVDWLAPEVEPRLSGDQAARRGGHCGANITRAFRHLSSEAPLTVAPPSDRWWRLLGRAGQCCDRAAVQADLSASDRSPGVLFADQSKAFERLSLAWYAKVLAGWGLPMWIQRGMLALVVGRAVQALVGGCPLPLRLLSRSIGLGGTASPWAGTWRTTRLLLGLGRPLVSGVRPLWTTSPRWCGDRGRLSAQ